MSFEYSCVTLATTGVLSAVVLTSVPAGASPVEVTCTSFTGNGITEHFADCDDALITGGKGTDPAVSLTSPTSFVETVTWKTGLTSIGSDNFVDLTEDANQCQIVLQKGFHREFERVVTGKVTGGAANPLVGGKVRRTVCVSENSAGTISIKNFPGAVIQY